jgi:hypothetical protein
MVAYAPIDDEDSDQSGPLVLSGAQKLDECIEKIGMGGTKHLRSIPVPSLCALRLRYPDLTKAGQRITCLYRR